MQSGESLGVCRYHPFVPREGSDAEKYKKGSGMLLVGGSRRGCQNSHVLACGVYIGSRTKWLLDSGLAICNIRQIT